MWSPNHKMNKYTKIRKTVRIDIDNKELLMYNKYTTTNHPTFHGNESRYLNTNQDLQWEKPKFPGQNIHGIQ